MGDLMSAESFKRKLTVILSADVKGYRRLMGEDEAETVKTLTRLRRKPRSHGSGGMRVSSDLSGEASAKSEALAKEDWSFGGLRRTAGATGSCPWGSTG